MKKDLRIKKLVLAKETLRTLDEESLGEAAAAAAGTQTCGATGCRSCYTCFCP